MKNILYVILENFRLVFSSLLIILLCLLMGRFGWALIILGITILSVLVFYWIEYKDQHKEQDNFRKWTKGK